MAPEILTEIFPQKDSIYSLRNSTALQGRSIKTVMYSQKLYLFWDQKYGTFYRRNLKKKMCLLHYSKRNFVNWPKRIVHVIYAKRRYKTLDFCKLSISTYLFCSM